MIPSADVWVKCKKKNFKLGTLISKNFENEYKVTVHIHGVEYDGFVCFGFLGQGFSV